MYCPHCQLQVSHLKYACDFSKIVYGRQYGTYCVSSESHSSDEDEDCDEDNYDRSDYEYTCPECEEELDPDDLLLERDEDDCNDESCEEKIIEQPKIIKMIISQL